MPYFLVTELSNDLPSGGIKIGFLGSSCRGAAHGKVCLNTQQPQAQSQKLRIETTHILYARGSLQTVGGRCLGGKWTLC